MEGHTDLHVPANGTLTAIGFSDPLSGIFFTKLEHRCRIEPQDYCEMFSAFSYNGRKICRNHCKHIWYEISNQPFSYDYQIQDCMGVMLL